MKRFTIITVSYNAKDCIEKTIQSVLSQSYEKVDYIIVDGGSKDGTVDIIKKYDKKLTWWCSEKDKGIYDGMNKGIRKAYELTQQDGEERYVLMLNADDTFYSPDVLLEVAKFMQDKDADVVCGAWELHPEHGVYLQKPGDLSLLPRKYVICHQATFVKALVLYANMFDLKYRFAADFHQLSSLYLKHYIFATCPDICISSVILNSGTTDRNWRASMHEAYDILRERGLYKTGEEPLMFIRKGGVRVIKYILPKSWSDAFFSWLGRHYKAI